MAKTLDAAGVKRLIQEIKGANKNLNTPIPISTENTPESKAQNVKNIADYVEKAKAAGVASVNGMAVTCLIDGGGYSGVGYLNGDTDTSICAIEIFDDSSNPMYFTVDPDGTYEEVQIIMENSVNIVTSDMLVEGARKPIILTPSTKEVDEETYQKLLSDDVDVVFMTSTMNPNLCTLTYKYDNRDVWSFNFTGFSIESGSISDTYLYSYGVAITKASPHTCRIIENLTDTLDSFLDIIGGYLKNSTLSPVLQEIDLTGTDADRKAKLDQFETDWMALTGASDLRGARFVGRFNINDYNSVGLFNYNQDLNYEGISCSDTLGDNIYKVVVNPDDGSLTITPLFSHLEAITIYTDNTPAHMQANLDNIAAYETNLQALGVDITKGWNAPVKVNAINGISPGIFASSEEKTNTPYTIISGLAGEYPYITRVNKTSGASTMWEILCDGRNYARITTNAKSIISAINEVNANAVHSDKLVPTLEAITIKTGNTPETKAANVAAIKAYVDNLKLLGVDVTKGYMIPAKLDSGNLDGFVSYHSDTVDYPWSGVFIRPGGSGKFGGMRKDGFVVLIDDILISASIYKTLTTTSKGIIPAINEVNALAKGYSTIFTPIELTTETAQNKTAIDARVAAFTAQGISLTNGCCIPVTYKGVYAGNISLINGDWYGLLVKNTNNPADNINIKLSADGTITEGNSAQ